MREDLKRLFPGSRQAFWQETVQNAGQIREIRIRVGQPVVIRRLRDDCYLDEAGRFTDRQEAAHRAQSGEVEQLLCHLCNDSPYAYEEELRQGFITVPGGHRIGVVGQVVTERDGSIRTQKHVSFLNIRIAHQVFGAADGVLPFLYKDGKVKSTLIVSPPGCGKTTLLRELIRQVSDGNRFGRGMQVGVVDERSELAGSYLGQPQNDLGSRTDVLDTCPKAQGMMLLLRSMAPQVLAVDELGGREDVAAVRAAAVCGSRLLATIHGNDLRDAAEKCPELLREGFFDRVIVLEEKDGQPGIARIYGEEEIRLAIAGRDHDFGRLSGAWTVVSGSGCRQDQGSA